MGDWTDDGTHDVYKRTRVHKLYMYTAAAIDQQTKKITPITVLRYVPIFRIRTNILREGPRRTISRGDSTSTKYRTG
jgi:hypothetical protein